MQSSPTSWHYTCKVHRRCALRLQSSPALRTENSAFADFIDVGNLLHLSLYSCICISLLFRLFLAAASNFIKSLQAVPVYRCHVRNEIKTLVLGLDRLYRSPPRVWRAKHVKIISTSIKPFQHTSRRKQALTLGRRKGKNLGSTTGDQTQGLSFCARVL